SAALMDCMETFFELLDKEKSAAVRAVLGHFVFVFIHPYPDGNGRIGRFLMNLMLASGGYPWTVIRLTQRKPYMETLEQASVNKDITAFTNFIAREMQVDWAKTT
ncbi:MAG TPA: Fic family protein, partial [Gammaproteobacteria bacterium]|nr:Fic family protein [Gammaproteobacteria bacterium]